MASTTALFTGLSGLNVHARRLDVIGNNIANVNSTAFKSSRLLLAPQFPRTFSAGSPPGDASGGTNPNQVGLGVVAAGTQRDMRSGAISVTGDARDLAIEGEGFFVVDRAGGEAYTRAGAFRPNESGELITIGGERLRGFGVDQGYNVVEGQLVNLSIPLGSLTVADATTLVRFDGNLNASGNVPTHGARIALGAGGGGGFSLIPGATAPATPPNVLEETSLLVEMADPQAAGSPLFTTGQTIEIRGAEKGSRRLEPARLEITDSMTVRNLLDFLNVALGLRTDTGTNPDGSTPGASLDPASGMLTLIGNTGVVNDLVFPSTSVRLLAADGALVRNPFAADKQASADGESVRTTFVVYDSLGAPVSVDLAVVMDGKSNAGTTWRFYTESAGADPRLTTGTLGFDTLGQLDSGGTAEVSIDRAGTGAASPLAFSIAFAGPTDAVTAYASSGSTLAATEQDGSPIGTLSNFGIGTDGTITGAFTNGLTRTLGRVALASFRNPEGLVEQGSNLFSVGPNSGNAVVTSPGEFGAGRIVSGALELSNVDLGNEFINMILTSTGYSASSRVIRTTDELLQQLLVLGR